MTPILETHRADDFEWLLEEHRNSYAQSDGFDDSFGTLVGEILDAFAKDHDPAREIAIIARDASCNPPRRLGSVFCVQRDADTAQLRLFYLVPEARGLGLGRRLLDAVMQFARDKGYSRMVLWTHESHDAAGHLYAQTGWTLEKSEPVFHFGQNMVQQH
ncbi:GNAT family N-acetyltransferase [Cognatishimia sp. F0-27]|uniref:GNAT family N-acetyltransferase n=1 Tax=Cognatishimia sp. F0-27 TaxID=2816855 RepID=UPI001D0CD31C|nr:GNAT family N-acetyltransferase [Cognatishimia sp. F0-27]MCC1493666.1 GNAT family N-acetyltransferase [Cognatishimia sp. F0-27]